MASPTEVELHNPLRPPEMYVAHIDGIYEATNKEEPFVYYWQGWEK